MISCDTNILFHACDATSLHHAPAREFLSRYKHDQQFLLCEQVLLELYCLLRNPTVCKHPLSAPAAVAVIQQYRRNPDWRIVDAVQDGRMMEQVWGWAAHPTFAYRKIFDMRLAATLRSHQVHEFATCNIKDFEVAGFARVWNPLRDI